MKKTMRMLSLMLAALMLFSLSFAAAEEEEPLNYTQQDYECQIGERTLRGTILLPLEAEGKLPTVILSHGYNTTWSMVPINYAKQIVGNGYACVMFDFGGGAAKSTSDGSGVDMTIFTEEEELKTVFASVKELPFVDDEQIFLLGISQGGMISALAAADLQEQVKALVLVFPAFSIPDDARAKFSSLDEVPETVDLMNFTIGRAFYEAVYNFDHLPEVIKYTGDVLILHGTADRLVPPSYSEAAAAAYPSAQLIMIEGAGHGFRGEVLDGAMVYINDFLKAHTEAK